MRCLIIAAGKGSRLQRRGGSKPLISILGVPLIERVIRSAMQAEIDDFYLVSGYEGDRVRHFLDGLARRCRIKITNIVNDAWQQGNGLSRWWRPRWRASLLVNHLPHFRRTHGPMV